jgi:hypothetical protein
VRVGNFSVITARQLRALVVAPELWNHYAAAVFRIRAPFTTIPVPRALRHAGRSKMNFVALMIHGLSAMSLYSDIIGTRLLIVVEALTICNALTIVSLLAVRIANSGDAHMGRHGVWPFRSIALAGIDVLPWLWPL